MLLKFTKMHGAGNDFVMLDGVRQNIELTPEQLRLLADRHFGVGCDQILIVEKAENKEADFRYRIFNADGGEVEQCGNGARCFMRFVHDQKLTTKREIVVETRSGLISPRTRAGRARDGQHGCADIRSGAHSVRRRQRRGQRTAGGRRQNAGHQRAVDG